MCASPLWEGWLCAPHQEPRRAARLAQAFTTVDYVSTDPRSTRAVLKTVIDVVRFGFASVIDTLELRRRARICARILASALHLVIASQSCIIISQQLSIAKA